MEIPDSAKPIPKVLNGGLSAIATVGIIAIFKHYGLILDPAVAGAIVTVVFSAIAYYTPLKYQEQMTYLNRVAELLVSMHPNLSMPDVVNRLQTPMATARLINSRDAIADLERGRTIR